MFSTFINLIRHTNDNAQPNDHPEPVLSDADGPQEFAPSEIDRARDVVTREQERAEARFEEQWYDAWNREASHEALDEWHDWRTAEALLDTADTSTVPTFYVDSLLLADCYQELFRQSTVESFVYLTGQQVGAQQWTLNRCIPISHAVQSAGGAEGDPDSAVDTLVELDAVDHQLLGHAHNHPGTGVRSVKPSDTDLTYQQELEDGDYTAVGLVMTRDGFARFFTDTLEVAIEVYGDHVTPIDNHENTFQLDEAARTAPQRLASA